MTSDQETILYRLYDQADALLYVGISGKWLTRMGQHANGKGWWDDVATVKREVFPSRVEALAAERQAIQEEHPRHNIIGVRRIPIRREPREPWLGKTYYVYCAYADDSRLLHVAVSDHVWMIEFRIERQPWKPQVAWFELEQFKSRQAAKVRAAQLIPAA